ncbi:hypothetical protein BC834DRAFT_652744 [Gloeopeniophorella convolvens]|nr:hypothetical protein BC834DRAFT_652744 [Gloeopeniophorella convolvens]
MYFWLLLVCAWTCFPVVVMYIDVLCAFCAESIVGCLIEKHRTPHFRTSTSMSSIFIQLRYVSRLAPFATVSDRDFSPGRLTDARSLAPRSDARAPDRPYASQSPRARRPPQGPLIHPARMRRPGLPPSPHATCTACVPAVSHRKPFSLMRPPRSAHAARAFRLGTRIRTTCARARPCAAPHRASRASSRRVHTRT